MATAVSFGNLTFATSPIKTDIMDIYKKNVSKLKNSSESLTPNVQSEEQSEVRAFKFQKEDQRFGVLTGINEDYYRPAEKVISKIEDAAKNSSKKPMFECYC